MMASRPHVQKPEPQQRMHQAELELPKAKATSNPEAKPCINHSSKSPLHHVLLLVSLLR